jgi:hypothetical protein
MSPTEEAAAIFLRVFESLARTAGKTLSQRTREDIEHACDLLANAAADLDVLEDLPRQSPAEHAISDPNFQKWRTRRYEED